MPSTLESVAVCAEVVDGATAARARRVRGESRVGVAGASHPAGVPGTGFATGAIPGAIAAILRADLIVLGPGSLYTSVLPNLLVPGVRDALRASRALKVYVCNVAAQRGRDRRPIGAGARPGA